MVWNKGICSVLIMASDYGTLELLEHISSNYQYRTQYNATVADLTVAFAVDFQTAGERLTKKVSKDKYLGFLLSDTVGEHPLHIAAKIKKWCIDKEVRTLNIAGNGLYTLCEYDWTQEKINIFMYTVLKALKNSSITKIISGGQTGVDYAGLVAGYSLGYAVCGTFPKGFRQRNEEGIDYTQTEVEVRRRIIDDASKLPEVFAGQKSIFFD